MPGATPPNRTGYVVTPGGRVWYQRWGAVGDDATMPPLVALGDGPGMPHETLTGLESLAATGRAVIWYDPLGVGDSDRPAEPHVWRVAGFLAELRAVRAALGLERIHLLGHGWGGMLALEYLLTEPAGTLSVILASAPAATADMWAQRQTLLQSLPSEISAPLLATTADDSPASVTARRYFYHHYIYSNTSDDGDASNTSDDDDSRNTSDAGDSRNTSDDGDSRNTGDASDNGAPDAPVTDGRALAQREPWPGWLNPASERWNAAANAALWGASGELARWDIRPRLGALRLPALVTIGRYDGLVVGQDEWLTRGIVGSKLAVIADCAHFPHAERPAEYRRVVAEFLAGVDAVAR